MTLRHRVRLLGSMAVLAGCTTPAAPATLTAAHRTAVIDSVRTMLDAWRGAMNQRDFARAVRFYSPGPDFRWLEDGEVRYTTRDELANAMLTLAPTLRAFDLSLEEPAITPLAPGTAVVTATFAQKMTDTSGRVHGVAGAVSLTVVHADSGWQIVVGQTSTLTPPAPAPPLAGRHS
ncbi:MAG TPA: nuclear transport factor 2 family protein [Gemmatimonadales bacterium]|jgi:ketosteroid isomerase-like protein|nr:nuclear transport factor 2 family protein [Gemmatimonadales bacterium]